MADALALVDKEAASAPVAEEDVLAPVAEDTTENATTSTPQHAGSFTAYCRICASDQLLGATAIDSKHQSAEGIVGYVRCPGGHLVIHRFAAAYVTPEPPASVIELRALLAAQQERESGR